MISVSSKDYYCEGFDLNRENGKYVLCANLGIGVAPIGLGHHGSYLLDEINAFDKAEIDEANIGQINMVTVSSFCGPGGLIWGYDIAPVGNHREIKELTGEIGIPVYSGENLISASKLLFGTIDKKSFPIYPGSHVFCASKNLKIHGSANMYAAIAIGIPKDRSKNACLLMEDVGEISDDNPEAITYDELMLHKRSIEKNLAQSIIEIGKNQRVEYQKIFVNIKLKYVPRNSIGCALVAAPYISLPKSFKDSGIIDNLEDSVVWDQINKILNKSNVV